MLQTIIRSERLMGHFKESLIIIFTGIILFGVTGCGGKVNKEVTAKAQTFKKAVENEGGINLKKLSFTYPANWSKRGNENELFFDDENKKTIGGISLVGYYGEFNSSLPNHSETLSAEDINIRLGKGKLFTLNRSHPAASNNNETWNEIHAIIPAHNKLAYDIWIKEDKETLLNILKSIK
jgi:hypothetical protein